MAGSREAARKSTEAAAKKGKSGGLWREIRLQMIAEAAYYRAEHRGFVAGGALQDWLEAEKEIDRACTAANNAGLLSVSASASKEGCPSSGNTPFISGWCIGVNEMIHDIQSQEAHMPCFSETWSAACRIGVCPFADVHTSDWCGTTAVRH